MSLREYPLKAAIEKVFHEVRALHYGTDSPCATCQVSLFCDKKPTDARWECGDAEAPIPYDCDVAVARAGRSIGRTLSHPLRAAAVH